MCPFPVYGKKSRGVAMGSPLGPVLAGIFMVSLENTLMPKLSEHMGPWKRYVDDTITTIKPRSIEYVMSILNSFHNNIDFTYELENNSTISFLDVLVIREKETIETTVYRKPTNNGIYLHWESFAPITWKRGTLRTIIQRAYRVCSNKKHLEKELHKIENDFTKINKYPFWIFNQLNNEIRKHQNKNCNEILVNCDEEQAIKTEHMLVLPYQGKRGEKVIKSLQNTIKTILPSDHTSKVIYNSNKLSSKFNIKDKTNILHLNDLTYSVSCPDPTCGSQYIGETARRLNERIKEHSGRDNKSHMYKHTLDTGHPAVSQSDFKVLGQGYRNRKYKRKISEALLIKELRPSLNRQENSVPLQLFN